MPEELNKNLDVYGFESAASLQFLAQKLCLLKYFLCVIVLSVLNMPFNLDLC